jgi:hypothetical protein
MWCRRVRNLLSAYADGELTPAQTRVMEEHLSRCTGCAREHVGLKQLARITGLIPEEALPAGLHERIVTRLAYADVPAPAKAAPRAYGLMFRSRWMFTAMTGAAAVVAFGFARSLPRVEEGAARPEVSVAVKTREMARPSAAVPPPKRPCRRIAVAATPRRVEKAQMAAVPARRAQPEQAAEPQDERAGTGRERPVVVAQRAATPAAKAQAVPPARMAPAHREVRPLPVVAAPSGGKPATEPRAGEPGVPVAMSEPKGAAMPGDPVVNNSGSVGQSEPVKTAMEKETPPRNAGMMADGEAPAEDEEGVRMLRMFLEERNRTVPQPPLLNPGRDRRMRKL